MTSSNYDKSDKFGQLQVHIMTSIENEMLDQLGKNKTHKKDWYIVYGRKKPVQQV